jgi:hypothetical protein
MPIEMENSALVHSDVEPRFDAYVHKLRLHASDGGRLIDLVEQRVAQREAQSRTTIRVALIALAILVVLLGLKLLK